MREYVKKSSRVGTFLYNYEATGQLTSGAPMGVEPILVTSTELVNNLNADMLDGHHASDFVLTTDAIDTIVLESIDDRVANTLLQNTAAVTWVYNDPANTLTPTIDHAGLIGLGGDHHMLYARVDGTRNFTGDQTFEQDVSILQRLTANNFTVPIGAVAGYVLTSDAAGNATWQTGAITAHGALTGLLNDDHTQYLRTDGTRICTGAQRFDTNVTVDDWLEIGYFKMPIGAVAGRVLTTDATGVGTWQSVVNTHAGLGGLTVDDHPQYLYIYGRAGGQTMAGGAAAGEDLTIRSTDNVTRGNIFFGTSTYDEANNRLGINTVTPSYDLDVNGTLRTTSLIIPSGAFNGMVLTSDGSGHALWASPSGISDHGSLAGLADDDHMQYTLVNGTRAFSGTVGGVTPTLDAHLTTKGYTDTQIALSGALVDASAKLYTDEHAGVTDHGALTGLADDDHSQYLLTNGSRVCTGIQDFDVGMTAASGVFDGYVTTSGVLFQNTSSAWIQSTGDAISFYVNNVEAARLQKTTANGYNWSVRSSGVGEKPNYGTLNDSTSGISTGGNTMLIDFAGTTYFFFKRGDDGTSDLQFNYGCKGVYSSGVYNPNIHSELYMGDGMSWWYTGDFLESRTTPSRRAMAFAIQYENVLLASQSGTWSESFQADNGFTGSTLDLTSTATVGGFNMPAGAGDGYVLTSDASGNGTWEPAVAGPGGDFAIGSSVSGGAPTFALGTDLSGNLFNMLEDVAGDIYGIQFHPTSETGYSGPVVTVGYSGYADQSLLSSFYQLDVTGNALFGNSYVSVGLNGIGIGLENDGTSAILSDGDITLLDGASFFGFQFTTPGNVDIGRVLVGSGIFPTYATVGTIADGTYNTGMWFPNTEGANFGIGFMTQGVERMRINEDGTGVTIPDELNIGNAISIVSGGEVVSNGSLDISADNDESGMGILTLGIGHASAIAINNDLHGGPGSIIIGADWDDYGGQPIMMYVGDNKTVSIDKEAISVSGFILPTAEPSGCVLVNRGDGIAGWKEGPKRSVRFIVDNGSDVIPTGRVTADILIPFDGMITGWSVLTYPSGSIELDILTGGYATLPPNTSIAGTEHPSVTADNKNYASTLVGWDTQLSRNDILDVNVISCSGITKCYLDVLATETL